MSNFVFGNTMDDVRNLSYIKLVATDKKRNKLVSEPYYYTTKLFSGKAVTIKINKRNIKMKEPVYLGLPILGIIKIVTYEY